MGFKKMKSIMLLLLLVKLTELESSVVETNVRDSTPLQHHPGDVVEHLHPHGHPSTAFHQLHKGHIVYGIPTGYSNTISNVLPPTQFCR